MRSRRAARRAAKARSGPVTEPTGPPSVIRRLDPAEPAEEVVVLQQVEVDGVPVVRLLGEVDAAAAAWVEDRLVGLAGGGPGLVVDLSGLRYLDSSAVRSLFLVSDRLAAAGGQLHVVVPPDSRLAPVVRIIQLDTLVAVHETTAAAVAALRPDGG